MFHPGVAKEAFSTGRSGAALIWFWAVGRLTGSYAAHRQGQLFAKAGHATRRAHDAAGSNGGAEAAANELGFGCVDVAGAVLRPEATARTGGLQGLLEYCSRRWELP